jgi:asparagine synthase (glutamine-hydrolysing)
MQRNKRSQRSPFSGCGIAGVMPLGGPPIGRSVVEAMTSSLSHRGPSGRGIWEHPSGILFGHHRLSIQDLSERGRQPMERGPFCITYNGEVYNFHDIRRELEQAGYMFSSGTDTEVILCAYERWGLSCFERFNGMFALAIWDDRTRELILARDRLGIKPLYYSLTDGYLIFASEVQALLKSGILKNEIDGHVIFRQYNLGSFLGYEEGRTCIKNVLEFPPAHWAVVSLTGEMRFKKYWQLSNEKGTIVSEGRLAAELRTLLKDSVRLRLVSDVPVAAFLSGGLDSSSIVAFAASLPKAYRLKTFTTWYTEGYAATAWGKEENDLKYARLLASRLDRRIEHNIVEVGVSALSPENMDCVMDFARVPDQIRDIAMFYNYKAVNDAGAQVVLNGQGSDELMGGYMGLGGFVDYFLFTQSPDTDLMERFLPSLLLSSRKEILNPEILQDSQNIYWDFMRLLYSFEGELVEKGHRLLVHTQLRQFVHLEDFLSMRFGVECRLPFLDYRLVEWVFRQPFGFHIDRRTRTGKMLLRKAMNGILPKALLRRPKAPFPLGDPEHTRQQLSKLFRYFRQEIIHSDIVRRIYTQEFLNEEHTVDSSLQDLWMLVSLWRWGEVLKLASASKENAFLRGESKIQQIQMHKESAMVARNNKVLFIWPPAVTSRQLPLNIPHLVAYLRNHGFNDMKVFDMNTAYLKEMKSAWFLYTLLKRACSAIEKNMGKSMDKKNLLYEYLCQKKRQIGDTLTVQEKVFITWPLKFILPATLDGRFDVLRDRTRRLLTSATGYSADIPLVYISIVQPEQLFFSFVIAREFKQKFGSRVLVVFGGEQVTKHIDYLKKSPEVYSLVDFLIIGDEEASFLKLLNTLLGGQFVDIPNLYYRSVDKWGEYVQSGKTLFLNPTGHPKPIFDGFDLGDYENSTF